MVQMKLCVFRLRGAREAPAGMILAAPESDRIAVQLPALDPASRAHKRDGESV